MSHRGLCAPQPFLFLSTLPVPVAAGGFAGAFFAAAAPVAFFGAGAAFLAGALAPFLTTVDVVSVLALLEALTRRPALAVVLVGPAPALFVRAAGAGAGAVELTVDEAVALRAVGPRVVFGFSTMLDGRPGRCVAGGLAGEAGRAMRDFVGEAGRSFAGTTRELEEAGERTWVGALAARVRRLGFSITESFSLPGPASSSLDRDPLAFPPV